MQDWMLTKKQQTAHANQHNQDSSSDSDGDAWWQSSSSSLWCTVMCFHWALTFISAVLQFQHSIFVWALVIWWYSGVHFICLYYTCVICIALRHILSATLLLTMIFGADNDANYKFWLLQWACACLWHSRFNKLVTCTWVACCLCSDSSMLHFKQGCCQQAEIHAV